MRDSLKAFLTGVATRWWFWAVTLLSGITTFTGLYYPRSLVERSVLDLAPAFGVTIFIGVFFVATYLTYKELYDRVPQYNPSLGEQLHLLYQRGNSIRTRPMDMVGASRWQADAEAFLRKHLPAEVRMFQTIGDGAPEPTGIDALMNPYTAEFQTKIPAQVEKLRLIMGRYESRRRV